MKTFSSLILVGALALVPILAEAQVQPQRPGGGRQRMQVERQLQLRMQEMMKAQLGLTDDELQAVQGVMQSFQEERMTLGRSQASLGYRLQDPALPEIGDEAARALLQEMVQVQEREIDLYRREQEQLLTLLSPSKLVRFYSLRDDMGRRMQQLRQGRGSGGPGGLTGPGGPGGPGGLGMPRGPGGGGADPGLLGPGSPDLFGSAPSRNRDSFPDLFAAAFGERYVVPFFR